MAAKKPRTAKVSKAKPQTTAQPPEAKKALEPTRKPPVKKAPGMAERMGGGPKQWWEKGAQFFREVKVELKKVTWPSRKETLASTSVVVALVLVAAVFLGLIDLGLSRIIRTVIG